MTPTPINLADKLGLFTERWSPKIIARMNDCHFKLTRVKGDFVWHSHPDTDEVFLVLEGQLRIDFRDGAITVNPGEMVVVPKGVEHKPFARDECRILVVESAGTVNTGDAKESERTVGEGEWI